MIVCDVCGKTCNSKVHVDICHSTNGMKVNPGDFIRDYDCCNDCQRLLSDAFRAAICATKTSLTDKRKAADHVQGN